MTDHPQYETIPLQKRISSLNNEELYFSPSAATVYDSFLNEIEKGIVDSNDVQRMFENHTSTKLDLPGWRALLHAALKREMSKES